jgi:hypothetical protein
MIRQTHGVLSCMADARFQIPDGTHTIFNFKEDFVVMVVKKSGGKQPSYSPDFEIGRNEGLKSSTIWGNITF